jgi:addiction module RelE/StbE family toxin
MKYTVTYQEEVVKKHIPALSSNTKTLIRNSIENKLTLDPVSFGKPLQYSFKGHRRLRVADYRIVYKIEDTEVIIIAIKHRKNIY